MKTNIEPMAPRTWDRDPSRKTRASARHSASRHKENRKIDLRPIRKERNAFKTAELFN